MENKPDKSAPPAPPLLVEGRDYYLEAGRFVFTAYFLKNRGFCCRSGCRHCPYGFRKGMENLPARPENGK